MMFSWLGLLLLAGLFYLIFRFGRSSPMLRGEHGGGPGFDRQTRPAIQVFTMRDPVCGMTVVPGQGYSEARAGREYHFCSRNCLDKFDAEPQRYAS